MAVTLRVNFVGGTLVYHGPKTGRRYEYRPEDGNGFLHNVSEVDVKEMIEHTVEGRDCGCSKDAASTNRTEPYKLFEEI